MFEEFDPEKFAAMDPRAAQAWEAMNADKEARQFAAHESMMQSGTLEMLAERYEKMAAVIGTQIIPVEVLVEDLRNQAGMLRSVAIQLDTEVAAEMVDMFNAARAEEG